MACSETMRGCAHIRLPFPFFQPIGFPSFSPLPLLHPSSPPLFYPLLPSPTPSSLLLFFLFLARQADNLALMHTLRCLCSHAASSTCRSAGAGPWNRSWTLHCSRYSPDFAGAVLTSVSCRFLQCLVLTCFPSKIEFVLMNTGGSLAAATAAQLFGSHFYQRRPARAA